MGDVFSKKKRSEVMSRVRSRGNRATELALIGLLRRQRISGWRRNIAVFGSPDFIFPAERVAIFVDGCFWHNCRKHRSIPVSNRDFWKQKLDRNATRDRLVNRTLRNRGWRVVRIWQHELAKLKEEVVAKRIRLKLGRKAS